VFPAMETGSGIEESISFDGVEDGWLPKILVGDMELNYNTERKLLWLSWPPDENPTPSQMRRLVGRLLCIFPDETEVGMTPMECDVSPVGFDPEISWRKYAYRMEVYANSDETSWGSLDDMGWKLLLMSSIDGKEAMDHARLWAAASLLCSASVVQEEPVLKRDDAQ
jgi:hypothetical protein